MLARIVIWAPLAVHVLALAPNLARAEDPAPISLDVRVNAAVARGLRYLEGQQKNDGAFPGHETDHPGGETALAGLALIKSGVARDAPALQGCVKVLAGNAWKSTYSCATYLMFLDALEKPAATSVAPEAARACLEFLLANQREGVWGYPADPIDMSNTQFALLGLRAAKHLGLDIPAKTLEACAKRLLAWQSDAGGFAYRFDGRPTGGMTAATLAGLVVIAELAKGNSKIDALIDMRKTDVKRAETWFAERFHGERNPYGQAQWTPSFQYAYLWAVERWCGLTGQKKIGAHDWYAEGAEWLLGEQRADGGWGRSLDEHCFALLFLRRATTTGWQDLTKLYAAIDREKQAAAKTEISAAADVPNVVDWWLSGPIQDRPGCALLDAPPLDVTKLDITRLEAAKSDSRDKVKIGNRAFERVKLKDTGWTDLEALTGKNGDALVWVLATRLAYEPRDASASRVSPLRLWFRFEDAWRVFLDGREISVGARVQAPIEETVSADVELAAGNHTLVVLVGDEQGASAFSMRASDPNGKVLGAEFSCGAVVKAQTSKKDAR